MPSVPHDLFRKFFDRVEKPADDAGCWLWTGAVDREGYGMFYTAIDDDRRTHRAPRISYLIHKGTIPDGMVVCHTCDVPACVNPDHLFIGSSQDNTSDMLTKGRSNPRIGERHGSAKLTEQDVRDIRVLRGQGIGVRELARRYNVSHGTITLIASRKTWKHVV